MGDSACFLSSTCLGCGRFLVEDSQDGDGDHAVCPHCGRRIDGSITDRSAGLKTRSSPGLTIITDFEAAPESRCTWRERAVPIEAAILYRQLSLPAEREPDVAALLADLAFPEERAVIWWDA